MRSIADTQDSTREGEVWRKTATSVSATGKKIMIKKTNRKLEEFSP